MNLTVKKLAFYPLFLACFVFLVTKLIAIFATYEFFFSLTLENLIQLIIISALILLSGFLFCLFATFADDWKIVAPAIIFACLMPFIFFTWNVAATCFLGTLIALTLTFSVLEMSLKNYLTFDANAILSPSIRHLATFLILVISIAYFFAAKQIILEKSFVVPNSIIDMALGINPNTQTSMTDQTSSTEEVITNTQRNLLLKAGVPANAINNISLVLSPGKTITTAAKDATAKFARQQAEKLMNAYIRPYLPVIPAILGILLFLTLQSIVALLQFLLYPLIWITFYFLNEANFLKYKKEMKEVKKLEI